MKGYPLFSSLKPCAKHGNIYSLWILMGPSLYVLMACHILSPWSVWGWVSCLILPLPSRRCLGELGGTWRTRKRSVRSGRTWGTPNGRVRDWNSSYNDFVKRKHDILNGHKPCCCWIFYATGDWNHSHVVSIAHGSWERVDGRDIGQRASKSFINWREVRNSSLDWISNRIKTPFFGWVADQNEKPGWLCWIWNFRIHHFRWEFAKFSFKFIQFLQRSMQPAYVLFREKVQLLHQTSIPNP